MRFFKNSRLTFAVLAVFVLATACTKPISSENDKAEKDKGKEDTLFPTKANALKPENGQTCSDFKVIQNESNKVQITFEWTDVEHTANYLLEVFESTVLIESAEVQGTETTLNLDKGKLYVWMVTSRNAFGEEISDTFSFITPGDPISNYVPYTAQIGFDFDQENSLLDISWTGGDKDGDPLTYNLIVKEEDTVLIEVSELSQSFYEAIPAISGKAYTAEVKSIDINDNYSISVHREIAPN